MSRPNFRNPFAQGAEKTGQFGDDEDMGGSCGLVATHASSGSAAEELGRVRKASLTLRKRILGPLPLLKKAAGFFAPTTSQSEARRNQLRDLLSQNSGPKPLVLPRPLAGRPTRPPRPVSIDAEVLEYMSKFPSPAAMISGWEAARKVEAVPKRLAEVSTRPSVHHSSPNADAPRHPPAKVGHLGVSLPSIPNVRQKVGVASGHRGLLHRRRKDPDLDDTHWEVLQCRKLRIPPPSHTKWMSAGVLGQGGFGTVYRVLNVVRRQQCAMKVVHYGRGLSDACCNGTINELKVLSRLAEDAHTSPFLLRPFLGDELWAWHSAGEYLHIVTELCTGGHLGWYKYNLVDYNLSLICAEVILGLNYLHRLGIVHHDLKPANILVNADGHCVIADFGGAQFLDVSGSLPHSQLQTAVMTDAFAAPELLCKDASLYPMYDEAVDYWALGTTLVSLLMDDAYLPGSHDMSSMKRKLHVIEEKMEHGRASLRLRTFVMALLNMEPSERPRFPEIGALELLRNVDWAAVEALRVPPFQIVKQVGAKSHGFEIPMAMAHETSKPVDFLARLRQEQLSLVVDDSYDVRWHNASIEGRL
ncbi:hypothetical protein TRAPUB_5121 [Trametes pubescens]|uniref:Protein kinase domain-containing protein n=1 Tax=Trametes pubescens TaxID=154538 RepID=A0A1M2V9D9_TRAPU|nr:hypothetical protein TRAPUB_5121 [Trametes pubescens]